MGGHSPQQLDILRKIGVDVWRFRAGNDDADGDDGADGVDASEAAPSRELQSGERNPADAVAADTAATAAATADTDQPPAQTQTDPPPTADGDVDSSLERIAQAVSACQRCDLHKSRTQTVFGCGSPDADWLFVGEAPGHNEDLQGQPFVGRAGQLLDRMIAALGMAREQVFIANVLKCRPPNNRDPLPREIEQCEPYLHRQLALIRPKVIVALGRISAQALLKTTAPLSKLRGRVHRYGPDDIPLVATYHPAYLLRSPGQKAAAWEDLWQARMIVKQ